MYDGVNLYFRGCIDVVRTMNPANVFILLLVIYGTLVIVVDFRVERKDDETTFGALYYTGTICTLVNVLKMLLS